MINWKKYLDCAEKAGYKITQDSLVRFQRQRIKYTFPIEYDQSFYVDEIPQMKAILDAKRETRKRRGIYGPTAVKIFNNFICSFFEIEILEGKSVGSLSEEKIAKILNDGD